MTSSGSVTGRSVDDHLGPAESRFFGAGYRRVGYDVREIRPDGGGPHGVRAVANLTLPQDWSRKGADRVQRPHLSTIDALILGVRAAETCVTRTSGLTAMQRRTSWLRRVEIKAGSAPIEDDFDDIEVEVEAHLVAAIDVCGRRLSSTRGRVATMKVGCQIEHEPGQPDVVAADRGRVDEDSLGVDYPDFYGEGYRHQSQVVDDVVLDMPGLRAEAAVRLDHADDGEGLEAAYRPSMSMIDSFVVALQLGQILLYRLDGITRATSNTLWMRHTTITTDSPRRPLTTPFRAAASLVGSRRFEARGVTWRTATIVGEAVGVRTACAVAHQLPDNS